MYQLFGLMQVTASLAFGQAHPCKWVAALPDPEAHPCAVLRACSQPALETAGLTMGEIVRAVEAIWAFCFSRMSPLSMVLTVLVVQKQSSLWLILTRSHN